MDVAVAISAERDQIFVGVVTQSAPRVDVVDLKTIGAATGLASPAVALQHFGAEFAIRIRVQPKPRSPWPKISH
jgi:CelD/BcsL family acetyltransferase involved in cellulose biosynthesis